ARADSSPTGEVAVAPSSSLTTAAVTWSRLLLGSRNDQVMLPEQTTGTRARPTTNSAAMGFFHSPGSRATAPRPVAAAARPVRRRARPSAPATARAADETALEAELSAVDRALRTAWRSRITTDTIHWCIETSC